MLKEIAKMTRRGQLDGHMPYLLEIKPLSNTVSVVFASGRRQDVVIEEDGEYYVMASTVMGTQRVQGITDDDFFTRLWQRNAHTDVVAFGLDKKGRLIGRTTHLKQTLDQDELRFYIEILARECDQLEYLLTGVDTQ